MILDLLINRKRNQYQKAVGKYGFYDKKTILLSQQLDVLISEKNKKSRRG